MPNRFTPEQVVKFFEHWGFEDVPDSGQWRPIRCHWHGDRHASARINIEEGAYACLACGRKGDILKLLMEVEKIEFVQSVERAAEILGCEVNEIPGVDARKPSGRVPTRQRLESRDSGLFSTGVRRRPGSGR